MITTVSFSHTDIRIIQQYWEKKPVEYIAMLIDKPAKIVRDKINRLKSEYNEAVDLYQNPTYIVERRVREKEWADRELKEPKQLNADMTGKVAVRIDSRTVIFVKPGADIKALKLKYKRKPIGE